MTQVPDEYYDELDRLVDDYLRALGDPDLHFLTDLAANAPAEAAGEMLAVDATGKFELTDEQVDHLWQLGLAEGYSPEELLSDSVLARARPERRTRPPMPVRHPLKGGGHGSGRGIPGKTEYPARWSDDEAMDHVLDVARLPDGAVAQPDGTFRAWGVRDGVDLRVVVTPAGDLVTAYPVTGAGVVTNPLDDVRAPYVERLQRLVEATDPGDEVRAGIDELMAVGEWDQVVQQLRSLPAPSEQQPELDALAAAADVLRPDPSPGSGRSTG